MVTRSRNFQRTPRRRKLFIGYKVGIPIGATKPIIQDMLDVGFTDLGMTNMGGLTVMDVRGSLQLVRGTVQAGTPSYSTLRMGYNWMDPMVAQAGDGDAQIPEPLVNGVRESKWIQQWEVAGQEPNSGEIDLNEPLTGDQSKMFGIHVRNMRKQPAADSRLCIVYAGGELWEANTVTVEVNLQVMLALP